ncbi:MAG: flagellar biosynthetic protein FliO [Alphaproteobacteria bacterium]
MNPDPESISWVRILIAFVVVFGLIAALGYVLKYMSLRGMRLPGTAGPARRLELVESMALDVRRRLVIIRCDGQEHLLLLGLNQDIVVAPNLNKASVTSLPTKNAS